MHRLIGETLVLIAYAALLFWLTLHHEPWRDEADSWLKARDCGLWEFPQFWGRSGGPMLWAVLLWPMIKCGLPYLGMNIINAMLGIAASAVIIYLAPFTLLAKSAIIFSYLFSYEYPIIARPYQVSVFLIFLLAAMHESRLKRPFVYSTLLVLLANSNVQGLVICMVLGSAQCFSLIKQFKLHSIKFIIPMVLGVVLSVVQTIFPRPDAQPVMTQYANNWSGVPTIIKEALIPGIANLDHAGPPLIQLTDVQDCALFGLSLVVAAATLWAVRTSKFATYCLLLSWVALMSTMVFKFTGCVRHWGFLVVVAIYAIWVARLESMKSEARKRHGLAYDFLKVSCGLAMVFSISTAVQAWISETKNNFSDAVSVARFLRDNELLSIPLIAPNANRCESILPYIPDNKLFNPGRMQWGTYMTWTRAKKTPESLELKISRTFGNESQLLLLVSDYAKDKIVVPKGFRQIYRSKPTVIVSDERYTLYLRSGKVQPED